MLKFVLLLIILFFVGCGSVTGNCCEDLNGTTESTSISVPNKPITKIEIVPADDIPGHFTYVGSPIPNTTYEWNVKLFDYQCSVDDDRKKLTLFDDYTGLSKTIVIPTNAVVAELTLTITNPNGIVTTIHHLYSNEEE